MIKLILFKFNYWSILLIFTLCSNLFASKWIYQADILNAQTTNKNEIKELSGNVIISKDDIILQTNRAILYSKNDQLELFGDIVMIDREDTLRCDTLFYFSNNLEYFIASGNVSLNSKAQILIL